MAQRRKQRVQRGTITSFDGSQGVIRLDDGVEVVFFRYSFASITLSDERHHALTARWWPHGSTPFTENESARHATNRARCCSTSIGSEAGRCSSVVCRE